MNWKIILPVLAALGGFAADCPASEAGPLTFDQKLPAPKKMPAATTSPGSLEKQFRMDTGETALTSRTELSQSRRLKGPGAKDRLQFKFDLSAWPTALRPFARLWVAVGALHTITTEGVLGLTFSQNGVGMSTDLNNTYNVDGMVILASDFAVKDGAVTVEIKNLTHLPQIDYTLHAIVYGPEKPAPK